MTARLSTRRYVHGAVAVALATALAVPVPAQTRITPDDNNYSLADDVKLGRDAAAEVRKQLPMLHDDRVDEWVEEVGGMLVAAIPPELRHQGFTYTFDVVNQKEINAFALPGGPMFLNRGMIEAARTEGEVAGVMAHEIAHVALRHGTAQATKGQKFELGALAGQVLGAVVGGAVGSIIAQGSQFGLGAYFLKYSREYEREADLLGAQIMARAGYDPRHMANMFRTIQAEGGRSGPEWLSSHPDPGHRYEAIVREAGSLRVQGSASTGRFESIKARLNAMAPAPTAEQIARGRASRNGPGAAAGRGVEPPSPQLRTHRPADFLRLGVPVNWDVVSQSRSGVTYAPEGGFFQSDNGRTAFTHGLQIGVSPRSTGDLRRDTEQLINAFARANPELRLQGGPRRDSMDGRAALTTTLTNVSDVTGQREAVQITTTHLRDGSLLFLIGVAPQTEAGAYQATFRRVRDSVDIAERQ